MVWREAVCCVVDWSWRHWDDFVGGVEFLESVEDGEKKNES